MGNCMEMPYDGKVSKCGKRVYSRRVDRVLDSVIGESFIQKIG